MRKERCLVYLPTTLALRSRYIDLFNTVPLRAVSILVNGSGLLRPQDAFSKCLSRQDNRQISLRDRALAQRSTEKELKVYINGDGADIYEDRFLSLATAEDGRFTPTLILVGIRLGIDRITPVYREALKASLQLSQSVGIAG